MNVSRSVTETRLVSNNGVVSVTIPGAALPPAVDEAVFAFAPVAAPPHLARRR